MSLSDVWKYLNDFARQFRALAWKNWKLKLRSWITLSCELLIPIIVIAALGGLKGILKPTPRPAITPTGSISEGIVSTFYQMYDKAHCGGSNLVWRCSSGEDKLPTQCGEPNPSNNWGLLEGWVAATSPLCSQQFIAVAPSSKGNANSLSVATNFVAWANARNVYYWGRNLKNTPPDPKYPNRQNVTLTPTFKLFTSEDEFLAILDDPRYSFDNVTYSSAVIFNDGLPTWDYSVRLNKTYNTNYGNRINDVQTTISAVDISVKSSDEFPKSGFGVVPAYFKSWLEDGYVALTNEVNTFIATETCIAAGKCTVGDTYDYFLKQSDIFPSPEYGTTGFWSALGFVFGLDMIVVLLYPLSNVISVLVREKEAKLREGMKMMSLKTEVLWLSWWFNFMALFGPLSLLLTFVGGKLFEHSDPGMIFLYFFFFFLSATAYAIFVSAFFTNSRTAAIVGSLVFLGGFLVFIGMRSSNPSRSAILAACLHPATAFTFSTLAFAEYEDTGIGVTKFTWNSSSEYNVTFRDCIVMMIVDTIWLGGFTWYFDKIWPSEYGTHEPWYFLLNPFYWKKVFGYGTQNKTYVPIANETMTENDNVEPASENLMSQLEDKSCVDIRNLRKSFLTPQGVEKVAVDGLNLTMFKGQITALLGHNGAGKTTAIAMLTGLIGADGGTAIIEGLDINEDMPEIRKNMGVCPQHDVLFPELTVEEHLNMFAMFKGVKGKDLPEAVNSMIASVGLTEKRDAPSRTLSGGQKRKLSVGIAFIGGSRIVFLDEPTSGMDPYSRRFTWNVIKQHREGRVIVLTTHFMDEADLLGDRIAIMGDGKLCCCGSSLYLKNKYGVGYSLTIEKKNAVAFDSSAMTTVVHKFVPDALVLNDVGTELTFQLPFAASAKFANLFEQIEQNTSSLGVDSYGISVTTLEEVFIKITRKTATNSTAQNAIVLNKAGSEHVPMLDEEAHDQTNALTTNFNSKNFEKIDQNDHFKYFVQHIKALLIKRAKYFVRDRKAQIFTFLVPTLFLITGLVLMAYVKPSTFQPLKKMSASLYNTEVKTNAMPTPYQNPMNYTVDYFSGYGGGWQGYSLDKKNDSVYAGQRIINSIGGKNNFPLLNAIANKAPQYISSPADMTAYLQAHQHDYEAMIVGTISLTNTQDKAVEFTISTNYTAVYGVPVYQQIIADATVRSLNNLASLSTNYYPLPDTKRQEDLFNNFNVDLVVTFITLALPFVPAAFITYVVREKEVKSKQQQMVSGVGVIAYWISTFLWDNVSFLITTAIFTFFVAGPIFGENTNLLGGGGKDFHSELSCFVSLLVLFGTSMTGFSYMCSYLFKQPSNAQIGMIFIGFIFGLIGGIIGAVLRLLTETKEVYNDWLRHVLCLIPPYAVADGLHNMALINLWSGIEKAGVPYKATDWEITGIPLLMMGLESIVYLALTVGIEYMTSIPKFQQFFDSLHVTLPPTSEQLKDEDVLEEERRCNSGECDESSTILVKNIKKQFYGGIRTPGKYAVKGVSLGIPNGQCFGLLGINGAGKTTFLSMLSGEFAPSAGEAYLSGSNLLTQIHKCRRLIGFCPQFDALFELLTAREHLQLYSRIKGIKECDIESVVNAKIREMGLTEYADRYAGTFSGGNKRKLSVAIAMIGEPSIVFLDEPSTGMDPVARRFMWDVISDIVTKREKCSVILTTHSMEECEALCTRIGIMVGGVLRCLGSSQRLRSKYGDGYQLEIGMMLPSNAAVDDLCKVLLKYLNIASTNSIQLLQAAADDQQPNMVFADNQLNKEEVKKALVSAHGGADWFSRVTADGNGSDLFASLEAHKFVHLRHLASWMILEKQYDQIMSFLKSTFGTYVVRERQTTKIRIEIKSVNANGSKRLLSTVFSAIENNKTNLNIQDYCVSQTSLEQIFNFFAAQQEEETGSAAGIQTKNPQVVTPVLSTNSQTSGASFKGDVELVNQKHDDGRSALVNSASAV